MSSKVIDLEKRNSEAYIRRLLNIKKSSFMTIVKLKLLECNMTQIFTYLLTLIVLVPYIYKIYKGQVPIQVYDTIAKLFIGAYLGSLFRRE